VALSPSEFADAPVSGRTVLAIDVLRATSAAVAACDAGCALIVPVPDEAPALARRDGGGVLLAGERGGQAIPGFDLGNSPDEFTRERVEGRTVVLTTTNGTAAMMRAAAGAAAALAALTNVSAAARWARGQARDVTLLCAGTNGKVAMEDDFPEQVTELMAFLEDDFPTAHPFGRVKAMPAPVAEDRYVGPAVWMLGSSMWSSAAAVEFGLPYSFAHFFSPVKTRDAIEAYMRNFRPGVRLEKPEATVAVGVICADTQEEAEFLSASVKLLQQRIRLGERKPVAAPEEALRELKMRGEMPLEEGEWPRYFVGTPAVVRERLEQMAGELGIDEVIVNTIVWDHEKRIRSYEMLAKEFRLG